jgi:hypothetical protein
MNVIVKSEKDEFSIMNALMNGGAGGATLRLSWENKKAPALDQCGGLGVAAGF